MFNLFNGVLVAGFVFFLILDFVAPARRLPECRWWRTRGLLSAALYVVIASYAPFLWDSWLGQFRLVDATGLPLWLAVPLGYAVSQLVAWLWHRSMHASDFLWRTFHQMHHSAERMDAYGALYFHPLDMLGFTFFGAFALTVVLGIEPLAAGCVGVFGALAAIFTHANLRTPRWIGWFIARPESHALHHERDRHARNYGELVIWDMLFGTYENPAEWNGQNGFYDGASLRVVDMLLFRDVSRPECRAAGNRSNVGKSGAPRLVDGFRSATDQRANR